MTRRRRFVLGALATLVPLVVIAEVGLRYFAGLGNPPRLMAHPTIEYLYEPSRTYWRRGNRIAFNRHSMRSDDDFAAKKASPREFRLMVLGDSVVNGGAQSDQDALATEMVGDELARDLGRPVVVGNVSAGSWGPPNLLAYVREYGLFDADAVVIVLSSHDAADAPIGQPFQPPRKPLFAIEELVGRFVSRVPTEPAVDPKATHELFQSIDAVRKLISLCQDAGADVIVLQHLEKAELREPRPGHDAIAGAARTARVSSLGPMLSESLKNGVDPYRDSIHLNDAGQRLLADAIRRQVTARFTRPASRPVL